MQITACVSGENLVPPGFDPSSFEVTITIDGKPVTIDKMFGTTSLKDSGVEWNYHAADSTNTTQTVVFVPGPVNNAVGDKTTLYFEVLCNNKRLQFSFPIIMILIRHSD